MRIILPALLAPDARGTVPRLRDCLFAAGAGQTILALANIPTEERGALYLIRLAAFALILVAIYRKNQTARG
jgi:hypothetical protein